MPTALHIRKQESSSGPTYYPLELREYALPALGANEVVVRISAFALNHRDLFIRQKLYPGIEPNTPLCADGCGVVTSTGSSSAAKAWSGKRVVITPGIGWKDDPVAPESPKGYNMLGGTRQYPKGTAVTDFVIDVAELEEAPAHLSDVEAAAIPLAGLTAWRATKYKAREAMAPGKNVLITGIGGGVALFALSFAVASGANVYVSSGDEEKLKKAVAMGAKGGVNYKEKDWDKKLAAQLPADRKVLDAIVDGAGAGVVEKGARLLKAGGVISIYGMTVSPQMNWTMVAVLKNIELRGSTMGSRKEFADMVKFVADNKVKPVVSKVARGLDNLKEIDGLFDDMNKGSQFGKLVVDIGKEAGSKI